MINLSGLSQSGLMHLVTVGCRLFGGGRAMGFLRLSSRPGRCPWGNGDARGVIDIFLALVWRYLLQNKSI